MDETIFAPAQPAQAWLRPASGVTLPLPDGTPWPAAGARVALDRYVRRRLADGDLVPCDPPASVAQDASETTKAKKKA